MAWQTKTACLASAPAFLMAFSFTLRALASAAAGSAPAAPPATVPQAVWVFEDYFERREVETRGDGRCIFRVTTLSHDPATASETTQTEGTWSQAMPGTQLLLLSGQYRLARVYVRGGKHLFDIVPAREKEIDANDHPEEWVEVKPGLYGCLRDLPPYSDETPLPGLAPTLTRTADVPAAVLEKINKRLPAGWSLTTIDDRIVIARDNRVEMASGANAPVGGIEELQRLHMTYMGRYTLVIRAVPLLTDQQRAETIKHNAQVRQHMKEMRPQLDKMQHKFDSWLPKNADEEALVNKYRELQRQIHPLPTHTDAEHSYFISDSVGAWAALIGAEDVTKTKNDILSLFSEVPPE